MLRTQKNSRRSSDRTANVFARAALASTSLPSCSSTSYIAIDPEAVVEGIFGASIDLGDRDAVLDLLESVLPLDADGTVSDSIVQHVAFTAAQRSATTSSGPWAPFYLTAQNLSTNGTLLNEIKPLSDFSGADGGDYRTLIPLIQSSVSQLVSQAGAPDGPNDGAVEALLLNLTGYPDVATFDVNTIGGCIGELRTRCGIGSTNRRSRIDDRIAASFSSYVALAGAVVRAWDEVQTTGGGDYLVVAESTVRRNLAGIESGLRQLRELVTDDDWLTTVLPTETPMVAAKFYRWVSGYVSTQAPQLLMLGDDGFSSIALTMKSIAENLRQGFISSTTSQAVRRRAPVAAPLQDCADPGFGITDLELPDDVCEGIPFAFSGDEVTDIVKSILCHVQQILDVAGSMTGTTAVIKGGDVVDEKNLKIDWASQNDPVYVRVCGNALESTTVYTIGKDGVKRGAQYHCPCAGGVTFQLDLATAPTGLHTVYAGRKKLASFVLIPSNALCAEAPSSDASPSDASQPTKKSTAAPKSKA